MFKTSPTGRVLRDPPMQNIPMPKDVAARMVARLRLECFLKAYPDNATCWSKATDELPDMYVWLSDKLGLDSVGRDNCPTPSAWNTTYKAAIRRAFDQLSDQQVTEFSERFKERLDEAWKKDR